MRDNYTRKLYFSDSCLKPNSQLVMWLDALCLNMMHTQSTEYRVQGIMHLQCHGWFQG